MLTLLLALCVSLGSFAQKKNLELLSKKERDSTLIRLIDGGYMPALVEEIFHVFQDWSGMLVGRNRGDCEIEAKMMLYYFGEESSYDAFTSTTFEIAMVAFLTARYQDNWNNLTQALPSEGYGGRPCSSSVNEFSTYCFERWRNAQ